MPGSIRSTTPGLIYPLPRTKSSSIVSSSSILPCSKCLKLQQESLRKNGIGGMLQYSTKPSKTKKKLVGVRKFTLLPSCKAVLDLRHSQFC